MKRIFLFLGVLAAMGVNAQTGIGTTSPDASAKLEVSSTSKGILFPRMTTVQRNAIISPANGLHVFDTDVNALWFFDGAVWINYATQAKFGDINQESKLLIMTVGLF